MVFELGRGLKLAMEIESLNRVQKFDKRCQIKAPINEHQKISVTPSCPLLPFLRFSRFIRPAATTVPQDKRFLVANCEVELDERGDPVQVLKVPTTQFSPFSSKRLTSDSGAGFLGRRTLSSTSSYVNSSGLPLFGDERRKDSDFRLDMMRNVKKISTFSPVCMGRRSCKIAGRKTAQNAKKMKLYARIGKEVVSAVKKGGPNPTSNTALAAVFEKARELDVPKEILERNIKRASEKGQEAYIEKTYEVYGFGGASMVVEVSTDKVSRALATVRDVLRECGGKMANSGSVMFKFRRARVVNVKVTDADKDQLLDIALDSGAEDVIEPPVYEDDTEEEKSESYYKVVSSVENYGAILSRLREEGIPFETDNGSELLPISTIEVDDEAAELNKELMSKLLDLNDVDAVYTDQK